MKSRPKPALLSLPLLLWLTATAAAHSPVPGEQPLAVYRWEADAQNVAAASLAHQQIIDAPPGMGGKLLKVGNPDDKPLLVNVRAITKPPITASVYQLRGEVRYEDVSGNGYLEMWSLFPDGGQYFSRTLGEVPGDPMARLTGTSDWRPFVLPFNATGASAPPRGLAINVVLPGRGTVYLTNLQLFQIPSTPLPAPTTGWSSFKETYGGFPGLGACLTVAMVVLSFLAQRGRHRAFVLAGAWTVTALTVSLLLAAILQAWKLGLPPAVWTVRLVAGVFVSGMFAACAWSFQRRYQRAEWRRMAAMDT